MRYKLVERRTLPGLTPWSNWVAEKVVRRFDSHEDADRADREQDRTMTPEERLDVLLEMR